MYSPESTASNHAFDRLHGHSANAAFTKVLLHFDGDVERIGNVETFAGDTNRVVDRWKVAFLKLNVENGSNYLDDTSDAFFILSHHFSPSQRN